MGLDSSCNGWARYYVRMVINHVTGHLNWQRPWSSRHFQAFMWCWLNMTQVYN